MNSIVSFIIAQVLPWVLNNLPTILKFILDNYPAAHNKIVADVNSSAAQQQMKTGQGPNFDWHSGP